MSIVTSITLVEKLKHENNNDAWKRFYELYSPLIIGFARQRGCNETSAKDILQETMCQLLQYLKGFHYNPKRGQFRSYLLRIVMSRISRHVADNLSTFPLNTLPVGQQNDIPDPNSASPWRDFDRLWRKNLMQHALKRVKPKVKTLTWKSFECYALSDSKSAGDVASELGIKKNVVYQHKNRVIELLKHEIKNLEYEIGEAFESSVFTEGGDGETVKTLLEEKQCNGDLEHFRFLCQSLLKSPIPQRAYTQFLMVNTKENQEIRLVDDFSVGSGKGNQLHLQSPYISRRHCIVQKENEQWVLKDLQSKNGVYVNNVRIHERTLINGDIVQIGDRIMIFLDGSGSAVVE